MNLTVEGAGQGGGQVNPSPIAGKNENANILLNQVYNILINKKNWDIDSDGKAQLNGYGASDLLNLSNGGWEQEKSEFMNTNPPPALGHLMDDVDVYMCNIGNGDSDNCQSCYSPILLMMAMKEYSADMTGNNTISVTLYTVPGFGNNTETSSQTDFYPADYMNFMATNLGAWNVGVDPKKTGSYEEVWNQSVTDNLQQLRVQNNSSMKDVYNAAQGLKIDIPWMKTAFDTDLSVGMQFLISQYSDSTPKDITPLVVRDLHKAFGS